MTLRRPIRQCLSVLSFVGLVVLNRCASGGSRPAASSAGLEPSARQVITEEQIAKSGARTAWEALQLTVHNITFYETRGQPTGITRRGRSSIYLDDGPRIMVDGVALTEYAVLTHVPASDLLSIEVLNAIDATTYYGTGHPNGVILIRTKTGS